MEMKMNFHHKYNNLIFIEKNIIVSTFSFFYKCIFLKKYFFSYVVYCIKTISNKNQYKNNYNNLK
jgi:hypothetical protein